MTNTSPSKMLIRYCYRSNDWIIVIGVALIIWHGLFRIFGLSPAQQVYLGQKWIPCILVMIPLYLVLFKFDFSKKFLRLLNFVRWGVMSLVMGMVMGAFFYFAAPYLSCISPSLAIIMFRVFFGFIAIFGVIISSWKIYSAWSQQDTPALILDHSGLWVDRFGLIPWSNIAAIGASVESVFPCLFIKVKDPEALNAQATRMGKLFLMITSKFGKLVYSPGYHISATGLDTPNDAIIAFASQYMQRDAQN